MVQLVEIIMAEINKKNISEKENQNSIEITIFPRAPNYLKNPLTFRSFENECIKKGASRRSPIY